jgi:hypothetical protein
MPTVSSDSSPMILTPSQWTATWPPFAVSCGAAAVGYGPLNYQWSFGGTNIDGATNALITLTPPQVNQVGDYSVTVTDSLGTNTAHVVLTSALLQPFFSEQPTDQAVLAGLTTSFTATALGGAPLAWQWQFNQTNIDGATNATLVLTNVNPDQAGVYSVTVTNAVGNALSSNAVLSVYLSAAPTMESFSLSAANQIQFTINGVPGLTYALQASTDMVNWDSIATNISPFNFVDTNTAGLPQRFYRAVYLP